MKKVLVAFLLAVSTALQTVHGAAESYTVEPSHTAVIFAISHFGYSFTYGRFNKHEGRFVLDRENPSNSRFQFVVDTASVDTNDAKRDDHLRGADFFNAPQFPKITFQSTSVAKSEKGYDVTGNLTLHGVTREITLPMVAMGEGTGPYGKYRVGMSFQLQIKRSDYGMKNMLPSIGDNVAITSSFEGIRIEPQ